MWNDQTTDVRVMAFRTMALAVILWLPVLLAACGPATPPPATAEDGLVRPAEPLDPESSEVSALEAVSTPSDGTPDGTSPGGTNLIRLLELESGEQEAVVEVVADRPMVWLSQQDGEQRLTVELPGTFPAAEVEEIATFRGLVAAVLFEADEAEPRTRLTILTREPVSTSLVPRGSTLQIRISPAAELLPAPEAVAATGDDTAEEIIEVQLGLFSVAENAAGLAANLAQRGFPAYVVEVTNSSGKVFHTVRLGPYASRGDARRAAAAYSEQEGGEAVIRWRDRVPADER